MRLTIALDCDGSERGRSSCNEFCGRRSSKDRCGCSQGCEGREGLHCPSCSNLMGQIGEIFEDGKEFKRALIRR
jgi:hypothetical protein